jgi:hypothetical protein
MTSFLFAHAGHTAARAHGFAAPKLPAALLANLAVAASFLAASGVVLFALHTAFAAQ